MPEATGTWTRRGPSSAAIPVAQRLGELLAPRHLAGLHAVGARHRGDVEAGQVQSGGAGDLLELANHLRIMYSSLRSAGKVTGTL